MGLLSGLTKTFKAVTNSSIGRSLLTAGAVYVGGAMLGMWESPFESINGLLAGGEGAGASADAATGAATSSADVSPIQQMRAGDVLNGGGGADMMTGSAGAPGEADTLAQRALGDPDANGQSQGATKPLIEGQRPSDAPRYGQDATADMDGSSQGDTPAYSKMVDGSNGVFSKSLKKVLDFYNGDFAKAALTAQIGGAIKSAYAPTPQQIAEAQFDARRRYDQQRAQDHAANYNVGQIKLPRPIIG